MNLTASKFIRRTHMYLALFLTPWLIIYALSGLVLNHFQIIRVAYGENLNKFEKVGERDYATVFSEDADARMIGAQILDELGLAGSFNVQGGPGAAQMVINRNAAFTVHRVTWFPKRNHLLIEKQSLTAPAFLNRAHFRHGYEHGFAAPTVWAVAVDLVVVALLFWIASGVWMWWEIRPARWWGAAFAVVGAGVFALLLATI